MKRVEEISRDISRIKESGCGDLACLLYLFSDHALTKDEVEETSKNYAKIETNNNKY